MFILCYFLVRGFVFVNITVKPVATLTLGHSMLLYIANYLHESGKPTTNSAIYGYKKDPNNKNHWLIDEEAATVVRRIFHFTIEGCGPYDIARTLFDDKVETRLFTLQKRNWNKENKKEFTHPFSWSGYVVRSILAKQEY